MTEFIIYRRGKKSGHLKVMERHKTKEGANQAVRELRALDDNYTYRIREVIRGGYSHK